MVSAPVSPPWASALKEGMFCASDWVRLGWPTWDRTSLPSTVTGAALSAAVMPVTRVPVTITASVSLCATCCASAGAARTDNEAPK